MPRSILTPFVFSTGGNTITAHAADSVPLTIKGASGQTAPLIEIRNSSNTLLSYNLSNGDWVMPNLFNSYAGVGTGYSDYQGTATSLYVRPTATNRSGAVIKALASQSADLTQWQDSGSVILAKVDSVGAFTTNSANGYSIAGAATFRSLNSGQTMLLTAGGSVAANPHVVIRQSTSAVGSLTEWQNSAGTVLGGTNAVGQTFTGSTTPILTATGGTIQSIATGANPLVTMASAHGLTTGDLVTLAGTTGGTYNGTFVVASTPLTTTFTITSALTAGQAGAAGTVSDPAQASITARSAGTTGLIIRAAASQSANITEWQNNSGTILSRVTSSGAFVTTSLTASSAVLNTSSAAVVPLTARGATSQSANLQEWQTVTPTTVASISPTGAFTTSSSVTTGAALNLNYASPTIASNNASAASIFTSTVTGVTIGSSTIRTTEFPADGTTSTATAGAGYMGLPQNATTTGAYTIVAADAGKHIYASATRTVTINSNTNLALPIGTTITFIAGTGATMTIAITTDTLILAGPGTTGSRTLAPFGVATAVKITSTSWIISGNGLT